MTLLFGGFEAGHAQDSRLSFAAWLESFRPRASARGIADDLYRRLMRTIVPDKEVYQLDRDQPEFAEPIWQYLNRRVSDWRVRAGREKFKEYMPLLKRVEAAYDVEPSIMAAIWGMESSYGEVVDNPKYMRPVLSSLATLAWGEPRRRRYWEQEFLNALVIISRGWASADEMIGSWAGAMGHTQWMPEVWLNMGVDFNKDGRISPFGPPDDAIAGTARFLKERGKYRRGEPWGFEVKASGTFDMALADGHTLRKLSAWKKFGIERADGKPLENEALEARVIFPAGAKGPGFALMQNFSAVMSYNPSFKYALAVCALADRLKGSDGFVTPWPSGEPQLSLEELIEVQQRLTRLGYDTKGTDGRTGLDTQRAVQNWQKAKGLKPADGYPGQRVLQQLREDDRRG